MRGRATHTSIRNMYKMGSFFMFDKTISPIENSRTELTKLSGKLHTNHLFAQYVTLPDVFKTHLPQHFVQPHELHLPPKRVDAPTTSA